MTDGPVILDKQNEAEPIVITEETQQTEQTLQEQLNVLQQWDMTQDGQSLAQRREVERERIITRRQENQTLQQNARQQLGSAPQVTRVAQGQPVQAVPAKQTYKQKKEEARRDKEAQKECAVGDHISYGMKEGLARRHAHQSHSMTPERIAQARAQNVDHRVAQSFLYGYKADKKGRPRTEHDQERKKWDDDFLDAYISKDIERRKPYLQRFTSDFLAVSLDKATLSDTNLEKHAGQVKQAGDKLFCFNNVYVDPVNKPYFDSLSEGDRELIDLHFEQAAPYTAAMIAVFQRKGIEFNTGKYYVEMAPIQSGQELAPVLLEQLDQSNATTEQKTKEIAERQMEREFAAALQSARDDSESLKEEIKTDPDIMERYQNITITGGATLYSFDNIATHREMIEENAAKFDEHKELLSSVYQEFYRAVDSSGDLMEIIKACQYVEDSNNPGTLKEQGKTATPLQLSVLRLADKKLDEAMAKLDLVNAQVATLADVMQFYLREKPLSAPARAYLTEHGVPETEIIKQEGKNLFGGENGLVSQSNASFDRTEGETARRSAALVAFGFRTSSSDGAQFVKKAGGDTFKQLPLTIADKFRQMDGDPQIMEAIQNMQSVAKSDLFANSTKTAVAAYSSGPGIDELSMQMFSEFSDYMQQPAALAYLKTMTDLLKDAKVFHGKPEEIVDLMLQSLANSYTAFPGGLLNEAYAGELKQETADVALKVSKNLLAAHALAHISQEDLALYPAPIQQLVAQVKSLVQTLTQKIAPPPTVE